MAGANPVYNFFEKTLYKAWTNANDTPLTSAEVMQLLADNFLVHIPGQVRRQRLMLEGRRFVKVPNTLYSTEAIVNSPPQPGEPDDADAIHVLIRAHNMLGLADAIKHFDARARYVGGLNVGSFYDRVSIIFRPYIGHGELAQMRTYVNDPDQRNILEAKLKEAIFGIGGVGGFVNVEGNEADAEGNFMSSAFRYSINWDYGNLATLVQMFSGQIELVFTKSLAGGCKKRTSTRRIGRFQCTTQPSSDNDCAIKALVDRPEGSYHERYHWMEPVRKACNFPAGMKADVPKMLEIAQYLRKSCTVIDNEGIVLGTWKPEDPEQDQEEHVVMLHQGHYWRVLTELQECPVCNRYHKDGHICEKKQSFRSASKTLGLKVGFYDFETRAQPIQNHTVIIHAAHEISLSIPAQEQRDFLCCARDDDGEATFWGVNSAEQFLAWTKTRETKIWLAHNGASFDSYFILNALLREEKEQGFAPPEGVRSCPFIEYEPRGSGEAKKEQSHLRVIKNGSRLLRIRCKDQRTFMDTFQHLRMKLALLGKAFDLPAELWKETEIRLRCFHEDKVLSSLEMLMIDPLKDVDSYVQLAEVNPELKEKLIHYCMQDVIALQAVWKKYAEIIFNLTHINPATMMTGSSLTFKAWTQDVMDQEMMTRREPWKVDFTGGMKIREMDVGDFIRESILGGRSEIKEVCWIQDSIFYLIDIVSMYPACMYNFTYPYGKPVQTGRGERNYSKLGIYKVLLKNVQKVPLMPVAARMQGLPLQWTVEHEYIATVTSVDLDMMAKLGFEIVIFYGLEFPGKWNPFQNYISKLFALKKEQDRLKDAGLPFNKALRETIKFLLNSLYGKLLQSTPKNVLEYTYLADAIEGEICRVAGTHVEIQKLRPFQRHKPFFLGTFVLAWSRFVLQGFFDKFGRENVYATETDSLLIPQKAFEEGCLKDVRAEGVLWGSDDPFIWEVGNELGNINHDPHDTFDEIILAQPKCSYMHCTNGDERMKMKGVSPARVDEDGSIHPILTRDLYVQLMNEGSVDVSMRLMRKTGMAGDHCLPQILTVNVHKTIRLKKQGEKEAIFDGLNKRELEKFFDIEFYDRRADRPWNCENSHGQS